MNTSAMSCNKKVTEFLEQLKIPFYFLYGHRSGMSPTELYYPEGCVVLPFETLWESGKNDTLSTLIPESCKALVLVSESEGTHPEVTRFLAKRCGIPYWRPQHDTTHNTIRWVVDVHVTRDSELAVGTTLNIADFIDAKTEH